MLTPLAPESKEFLSRARENTLYIINTEQYNSYNALLIFRFASLTSYV
jgi:hypothetical protein